MDATILTAIIGALATITAAIIGALAIRAKDRANNELKKEWMAYSSTVSKRDTYLDVDYGIRIVSPRDGEGVSEFIEIMGVYALMPPPETLRLFTVNPNKTNYGERFWPQVVVTDFYPETKTWRAKVNIADGPSEIKWGVIAAIVGPTAIVLWNFYYKVGPTIGWWDIEGWPPDTNICHRIAVRRK